MKDAHIRMFCNKKNIKLPLSWRSHCNKVCFHNKNESWGHFMMKAKVAFSLMKQGQTVFTEMEFEKRKGGDRLDFPCADIFWLDELKVIELESKPTESATELKYRQFAPFDVFIFDLRCESLESILKRIGCD